jgi:hypothetical protein
MGTPRRSIYVVEASFAYQTVDRVELTLCGSVWLGMSG